MSRERRVELKVSRQAGCETAKVPDLSTEWYSDVGETVVEAFLESGFFPGCYAFSISVLQVTIDAEWLTARTMSMTYIGE